MSDIFRWNYTGKKKHYFSRGKTLYSDARKQRLNLSKNKYKALSGFPEETFKPENMQEDIKYTVIPLTTDSKEKHEKYYKYKNRPKPDNYPKRGWTLDDIREASKIMRETDEQINPKWKKQLQYAKGLESGQIGGNLFRHKVHFGEREKALMLDANGHPVEGIMNSNTAMTEELQNRKLHIKDFANYTPIKVKNRILERKYLKIANKLQKQGYNPEEAGALAERTLNTQLRKNEQQRLQNISKGMLITSPTTRKWTSGLDKFKGKKLSFKVL